MEGRKREGVRRMEGSEVVCSVRVWYHVYASPVHPEMCDNWLLKTYSNFIMVYQDRDHCYVTDRKWWTQHSM